MRPHNSILRFFTSFYGKIAIVFVMFIGLMGVVLSSVYFRALMEFQQESSQRLNENLATHLANELRPFVETRIDQAGVEHRIHQLMTLNHDIEIYVLDNKGKIKAAYSEKNRPIQHNMVNLKPIHTFLQHQKPFPILGDDPRKQGRMKPFSVAKFDMVTEKNCYIYVILGSEGYDEVVEMLKGSYIWRALAQWLIAIGLVIALLGLFVFRWMTKPMRNLENTVLAFKEGKQEARIIQLTTCEIGQASASFNEMADTIQANVAALKQTDQLRRELIANISHDLRSPIASIQGYLETLELKESQLSLEERQYFIAIALKNTQRLETLISDLFELSKLDADQTKPVFERFNLTELMQDLTLQFQPVAQKKNILLNLDTPNSLHQVCADIGLMERAISNLLDNAIKYSPEGTTVEIQLHQTAKHIEVQVSDHGVGISDEDLPHIFERFYRVDKSRNRAEEGTGLGLAIAEKIIKLHGTVLHVRSKLHHGTTFSFVLPFA